MSIWYTNADSILNKIDELKNRISLSSQPPDIIAVTEIKPKNSRYPLSEAEIQLNGYVTHHRNTSNKEGRGICVYVKDNIQITEVNLTNPFDEYIVLSIKLRDSDKLIFGTIYRSPNSEPDNNSKLLDLLEEIDALRASHILIVGDFNYPSINWRTGNATGPDGHPAQQLHDKVQDCFWVQKVEQPTRKRGQDRPSLLDLIITNDSNLIEDINYESPIGNSDHCLLSFEYKCYIDRPKIKVKKYFHNKTDFNNIRNLLNLDWDNILLPNGPQTDIDEIWSIFEKVINSAQDKSIPNKLVNAERKKRSVPLDNITVASIRKKHRLWTRYIETNSGEKLQEYKRARNKLRNTTRRARRQTELSIAKCIKDQPKKFWNYVNSKSKVHSIIPDLEEKHASGVKTATNDKDKAEMLSEFFSRVLIAEEDSNYPSLPNKPVPTTLETITIDEDKIKKKLKALKTDKSPGPDNIFPNILKAATNELAHPLSIIFKYSLKTKTVPKAWKIGHIKAIHKKGPKKICENYRPISLTSIVCKIMESIVRDAIMDYMTSHHYLSKQQFGFMPKRSTVLQLLKIIDEWTEALDNGKYIEAIYMDIQKAFDTVPHRRLMYKLQMYGISGDTFKWLENFLTDRLQYVEVNREKSSYKRVTSGVPQGSVLGPLLFIIYINDLPDKLLSTTYLFADDTKIYQIYDNDSNNNNHNTIQQDLDTLQQWSDNWLLKLHPQKCKRLIVKKPSQTIDLPPRHLYTIDNNTRLTAELTTVQQEKDVGVIFDNHLSFKHHINEIIKKASQMMGLIRRSFSELTPEVFRPIYVSLVRSRLEYAQAVWSPHLKTELLRLERVQRNATKQVNGFKALSYPERLQKLRLPTLAFRRKRGDMVELYKLTHGLYDEEVKLNLPINSNITRGHQYKLFKQRTHNIDTRKYCFTNRVVDAWNSLPEDVVNSDTLNTFKNRLDKHWREDMYKLED